MNSASEKEETDDVLMKEKGHDLGTCVTCTDLQTPLAQLRMHPLQHHSNCCSHHSSIITSVHLIYDKKLFCLNKLPFFISSASILSLLRGRELQKRYAVS